jgi:hypothetical protein
VTPRDGVSEARLAEGLRGRSACTDEETVTAAGQAVGVSASAVSCHLVEATATTRREVRERRLEDLPVFALFLETSHRGGHAFIVALGIDLAGTTRPLGCWEGATENPESCAALLADLERQGLQLSTRGCSVTDGARTSSRRGRRATA